MGKTREDDLNDFLIESHEKLDAFEQLLLGGDARPMAREELEDLSGILESLRSSALRLGFPKTEALARAGGELVSQLREGRLEEEPRLRDGFRELLDSFQRLLAAVEFDGTEAAAEAVIAVIERMGELARGAGDAPRAEEG